LHATATLRQPTRKSATPETAHAAGTLRATIAQAVAKGKIRAAAYAIELAAGQDDPDTTAAAITLAFCRGMANSTAVTRAISGAYIWVRAPAALRSSAVFTLSRGLNGHAPGARVGTADERMERFQLRAAPR
jgi:hypothetical protein